MRSILLLTCLVTAGFADAADSPAEAAMKFCEALRDGKEQDQVMAYSALNPHTGEIKKEKIFAQWKREAQSLLARPFEIAEEQTRGDQAAVILSQWDAAEGRRFQLTLIACIKRDGKWLACPVMGSFENSSTRYDPPVISDRQALTSWLHSREVQLREQWQLRIREQWQQRMAQSIAPEALISIDPRSLIDGLFQAIRARDQAAILARLGGFSQEDVTDWSRIERRLDHAMNSDAWMQWPWKLFSQDASLIALGPAMEAADETIIEALVLHPDSLSEEPDFFSFTILRDRQGRARVQLPDVFLMKSASEEEMGEIMDADSADQRKLYDQIRQQARSAWNHQPLTQPEALADIIERSLQKSDFASFWGTGCIPSHHPDALLEMPAIISLWQKLHGSAMGQCLFGRVGFQVHQNHALLAMQSYAPHQDQPIAHHKIWLEKRGAEWFLCDGTPADAPDILTQWWSDQKKAWSPKMADSIIEQITRIGGLAPIAPEPEKVRQVFSSWLAAQEMGQLMRMLPHCAAFQDERSVRAMLQNLTHHLTISDAQTEILDVRTFGRWATVSTRYTTLSPKPTTLYPLFVFVVTDDGPRLLPQIDLKLTAQENPSRPFLNLLAIRDLKKFLPDSAVGELQHLYEQHLAAVNQLRHRAP
jgi:hypothetical protein